MSFLNSVITPTSPDSSKKKTTSSSGFLSSVTLPKDPIAAEQSAETLRQTDAFNQQAADLSSFSGMAKSTFGDLGHKLVNIPVDFAHSLWETYKQTPEKLIQDVQSGANDIAPELGSDKPTVKGSINVLKGVAKSGGRTAGDVAIAVFAPISSAIGALLNATGGQKLTDATGQVIADKSGITDLRAFQQFAVDHPNAGEDFNRILTLFMSKAEKGQIDPVRMASESKSFVTKLVGEAKKAEIAPAETSVTAGRIIPDTANTPAVKGGFLDTVVKEEPTTIKKTVKETPVNDVAVADSVRSWLNEQKPIPENILNKLEKSKVGVDEIPFNDKGEVTLYRDKTPTPGKVESFSLTQKVGQEPFTVSKDQVVTNLSSDAMKQVFEKAYPGTDIQNVANKEMLAKYGNLEGEVLVRNPGGEKITKAASDISQKLVEKGFDALTPEQAAKYDPITKADQIKKVASFLDGDIENARKAATGKAEIPRDINSQVLFNAVEADAIKNGNIELLRDLAKSPVAKQLSEAGQTLSAHGFNDNTSSPVKAIQDIQNAREAKYEKTTGEKPGKAKKATVEEIKKEIKKVVPKKQNWSEFIESIQCGY